MPITPHRPFSFVASNGWSGHQSPPLAHTCKLFHTCIFWTGRCAAQAGLMACAANANDLCFAACNQSHPDILYRRHQTCLPALAAMEWNNSMHGGGRNVDQTNKHTGNGIKMKEMFLLWNEDWSRMGSLLQCPPNEELWSRKPETERNLIPPRLLIWLVSFSGSNVGGMLARCWYANINDLMSPADFFIDKFKIQSSALMKSQYAKQALLFFERWFLLVKSFFAETWQNSTINGAQWFE